MKKHIYLTLDSKLYDKIDKESEKKGIKIQQEILFTLINEYIDGDK